MFALSNVLYLPSGITVTISVLKRVLKSKWLILSRGPVRTEFLLEIHQSDDIEIQLNR